MALVQLREQEAVMTGVPHDVLFEIRKQLRYRPAGYRYDPRYKYKRWDGYVHLCDDLTFPVGLLHRVRDILKKHNIQHKVEWVDEPQDGKPVEYLLNSEIETRWYQTEAAAAAVDKRMGVIRAPTGAGKTVIASRIIHDIGRVTLVIVPTLDLLFQTKSFFEWALQREVGQLGGGVIDPKDVTVGTTRSVAKILSLEYHKYEFDEDGVEDTDLDIIGEERRLGEWVRSLGLVIFDECHVVAADTAYNISKSLSVRRKFGMSASPWRDDNADLKIEAALGPVIYRVPTEVLVNEGFLVPPIIMSVSTQPDGAEGQEYKSWSRAYAEVIAKNEYRNNLIVYKVQEQIDAGKQVLVLVKQLKHGERLRKMLPDATFIAGSSPEEIQAFHTGDERQKILNGLREGSIRCVIATTIADMGIDIPSLDVLVLAGGGKSSTRHLQRIGRVCRPYPNKQAGLVIDFDDSWAHVKKSGTPGWFANHVNIRRKVEKAEWGDVAYWL